MLSEGGEWGRIESAIKSLVKTRGKQVECARVSHEPLFGSVLMHGGEIMIWKEKERSRIRYVQMDYLRGLLGIRRMDKVLNARITGLCGVTEGLMKVFSDDSDMWKE